MVVVAWVLAVLFLSGLLPAVVGACLLAVERGQQVRWTREGVSLFFRDWAIRGLRLPLCIFGLWDAPVRENVLGNHLVPVILVPGFGLNRGILLPMQTWFRRRGWRWVVALNHRPSSGTIPSFAERLAREVERLCERTGAPKVDIVAHSMGGLVAGWYLGQLKGAARVRRLVTLGTPFSGTRTWVFGWRSQARDLAPANPLLDDVNVGLVPTTALWSRGDYVVLPQDSAHAAPAEAVEVAAVSHDGLCLDGRVWRIVEDVLLRPEETGPAPEPGGAADGKSSP
jgi:pimeloyl-ACP methyl ester carboxylesterase